jgi:hypothetical protein
LANYRSRNQPTSFSDEPNFQGKAVGGFGALVIGPRGSPEYRDGFGNWCTRLVAPGGRIRLKTDALIRDTGQPDRVVPDARQRAVQDLPEETLFFLLGSRYCETDLLSQAAWDMFGQSQPGWARTPQSTHASKILMTAM